MKQSYTYLASPYSNPDPRVVEERYKGVSAAVVILLSKKILTYSPIVHWHNITKRHNLPTDAAFWKEHDHIMIDNSSGILVLMLLGWENSKGVSEECNYAMSIGLGVGFIDPDTM